MVINNRSQYMNVGWMNDPSPGKPLHFALLVGSCLGLGPYKEALEERDLANIPTSCQVIGLVPPKAVEQPECTEML